MRAHDGWVYPGEHSLDLLIDIKSDAGSTYEALRGVLAQYSELLTTYSGTEVHRRAISVIVSGNRPRDSMMAEPVRLASYDGRIEDLEDPAVRLPANFVSIISDNWEDHFSWSGLGELSDRDSRRLAKILETAHRSGYRVRFWNIPAPDRRPMAEVWGRLLDAGVDLLSIDDVSAYRDFLARRADEPLKSPNRPSVDARVRDQFGDGYYPAINAANSSTPSASRGSSATTLPRRSTHEAVPDGVSVVRGVCDEHDGNAAVSGCAYVLQDSLGLPHSERRGGLVQDQDTGAEVESPGDRNGLTLPA